MRKGLQGRAQPRFPSGQSSALLGCVVRAAAGENTEQQHEPGDLNHLCFGHFRLRGSIWGCPRPERGVTSGAVVWVGAFSLCLCGAVAVFAGMWGHCCFPFPAALFVEAIKEAPLEFPACTALMSFRAHGVLCSQERLQSRAVGRVTLNIQGFFFSFRVKVLLQL